MVVFVDLEDDAEPPESGFSYAADYQAQAAFERDGVKGLAISDAADQDIEMADHNRNSITEVFACYPAVTIIISRIDLNTLDNLARTCHQIRDNLIQFRSQLISQTLHCCNESIEPNRDHTLRYRARAADWYFMEEDGVNLAGKVGHCARDMVAECRRCQTVICRNCTIKPPAPVLLRHRHRRLCPSCTKAPLPTLLSPAVSPSGPLTKDAVKRSVCLCDTSGVWLCQPCGRTLRSADNTYESIWKWRTRYGPSLGGLGTGIGEGNRNFECGRAQECCAARMVEEEVDCDAQDAKENMREWSGGNDRLALSTSPTPSTGSGSGSGNERERRTPGYARHEIEGIGGVVKKKLVRMVKVGACVDEYEGERSRERYMEMEMDGKVRSWCGWCWRAVPGVNDRAEWGL